MLALPFYLSPPPPQFSPPMANLITPTLLLLALHLTAPPPAHAVLKVWVHNCDNTAGNYTTNSTYKQNLDSLFTQTTTTNLASNFYNFSTGQSPDATYLISLCLGNITPTNCHLCQEAVISNLTQIMCPIQKTAIAWSDDCFVRYSNKPIFGAVSEDPAFLMLRGVKASDETVVEYSGVVEKLLDSLPGKASSGDSRLKFADAEAEFNSSLTIFAAAQCTPDLTREDCLDCLKKANELIQGCSDCRGQRGARELLPSCMVRYEENEFYLSESISSNTSGIAPSPSPVAPVTPSTSVVPQSASNTVSAATERFGSRSLIAAISVVGACSLAALL